MTAALLALPIIVLAAAAELEWVELIVLPTGFLVAAVASASWTRGDGIDLDESGVHPVLSGKQRREYAPWHHIIDIRAERRAGRTVPVIYLESGKVWRLRVPYDGIGLGADAHFDEKLSTLRNMWDTYRSWQRSAS